MQLLYRAWKSLSGAAPRWAKTYLIEGLRDEEVSIDWGRINHWYETLSNMELPPANCPSGIVSQFWDGDRAMYQAVLACQAYIPEEDEEPQVCTCSLHVGTIHAGAYACTTLM